MGPEREHAPRVRTRRAPHLAAALAFLAVAAAGCGPPADPPAGRCEDDPRAEPFGTWIARSTDGGEHTVMLEHAAPAPPRPGINTWRMQIISSSGSGSAPERVRVQARRLDRAATTEPPWHDASRTAGDSYRADFTVDSEGLWEVRVEVAHEGRVALASFTLCIAEPSDAGPPADAGDDGDGGSIDDGGDAASDSGPPPEACEVTAPASCPDETLTYADVAPIVMDRCVSCHDGRGSNWALDSYSHVVDWADDIRARMLDCTMPPPTSGLTMPNAERQLLVDWLRCGAPP